jgi:hypothetical protein
MLRLSAYLIMVDNEANFLQCPLVSMDYIILVAILDIAEKDQISTNPFHVHNLQWPNVPFIPFPDEVPVKNFCRRCSIISSSILWLLMLQLIKLRSHQNWNVDTHPSKRSLHLHTSRVLVSVYELPSRQVV